MRTRIHPGLLALLVAVLLVGGVTLTGHGPLAGGDDATSPPPAGTPTPAPADQASAPSPTDTTPGAIPVDTDAAPLAKAISDPDLPAFERVNVKLATIERSLTAPVTPQARELATACKRLDTSVPLLAALRATCADTITFAKLRRVLLKRCATPTDGCARTATRFSAAATGLVKTRRAYARTIRAEISASACRRALLPTGGQLAALRGFARAFDEIAAAASKSDPAALQRATSTLTQARREAEAAGDGRPSQVAIDDLRAACHLTRYPDPIEG